MKLSLCLSMAAGLAAAAAPVQGQLHFNSGRTYTSHNAGTPTFIGYSSGNLGGATTQRWTVQAFTIPAGGATVGLIEVEGFGVAGSDPQDLNWIIWTRTGFTAPTTTAEQLHTGSVPLPPCIPDARVSQAGTTNGFGTFQIELATPINLAAGDYWLTVYGSSSLGTANFAWAGNAQVDPDYWTPVNTPMPIPPTGSYMHRSTAFPSPGFTQFSNPNITVDPAPTSGPGSAGHSIPAQNPQYLYNTAFRIAASPPTAACCHPDGSCTVVSNNACLIAGGVWTSAGTTCAAANCPQPGACCRPDGTCSVGTFMACYSANGVYHGNGSTCAAANCAGTGACCQPDNTCAVATAGACAAANGVYRGNGSACASANCPTSYAYLGSPVFIQDASGQGGTFCGAEAIAEVTVTDNFTVAGADVSMFITHEWQGDLVFTLTHVPSNTSVEFYNRVPMGSGGTYDVNNFGASPNPADMFRAIDSADHFYRTPPAPAAGIPNARGLWKPDVSFAAFAGVNSQGVWRLRVKDCGGPGDIGNLETWALGLHRPSAPVCYANCDGSTQPPVLNVQDFSCFLTRYAAGESYANCDGSTQPPVLNVQDFSCFLTKYAAGC